MTFSTPKFWYKKRGLKAYALLPIAWLYQIAHKLNQSRQQNAYIAPIPVICIGNAITGGGGKTPTVLALHKLIKSNEILEFL